MQKDTQHKAPRQTSYNKYKHLPRSATNLRRSAKNLPRTRQKPAKNMLRIKPTNACLKTSSNNFEFRRTPAIQRTPNHIRMGGGRISPKVIFKSTPSHPPQLHEFALDISIQPFNEFHKLHKLPLAVLSVLASEPQRLVSSVAPGLASSRRTFRKRLCQLFI